jgi:hypothetical protein
MLLPAAGLPRQGMRNLYTTLCKLAETLEHLMHLFLPLLLTGDAPVAFPLRAHFKTALACDR